MTTKTPPNNTQLPQAHAMYLQRLDDCSPFMARLLAKDAELRADLLAHVEVAYTLAQMQQFLAAQTIIDEASLKKALRKLRQRVYARIITRDLNGLADVFEVMHTTTQLAEIAIKTAVAYHTQWLQTALGQPLGDAQTLIVVGMGKLGGGELNVSSDVDLIFAYDDDAEPMCDGVSAQEFFTKLGKKVIAALDEVTEDGFVFRVDMRLRPFGSEGVLVSGLNALEEYYQNNGREWERYAWIKGRALNVDDAAQAKLHGLLKPFVYRKYLDFNAYASMRDLKLQIHRDVLQKGLQDNIKLGRGGIREVEFIAQVFQLIRGGQDTSLQLRPTLEVLKLLQNKRLLPAETVAQLTAAYVFLRNLEHRLMYVEDAQTQALPTTDAAKARITRAMNFEDWPSFEAVLTQHRQLVQQHFDATFNESAQQQAPEYAREHAIWQGLLAPAAALKALSEAGFKDADSAQKRLSLCRESARYQQLPDASRQRFDKLMPLVIAQSAQHADADIALHRVLDLLEAICRRASYLALLAEYPQALQWVVKLCAASSWCAQYLTQHPIVLDELLDEQSLYAAPDFAQMRIALEAQMHALAGDTEAQMNAMRQFKHAAVFRFAAQDIAGTLGLQTLSDYLSALADVMIAVALTTIWQSVSFKHIDTPKFAVIGYGKLGGQELAYASDLDIIFLYDFSHENASHDFSHENASHDFSHENASDGDDAEDAGEIYARFAQRINSWFNSTTAAGMLYEIDLALRPDGNSGLLVSTVDAFRDYQLKRAWVWEHQAITRARFVAGDACIGAAFEAIRAQVVQQTRNAQTLAKEVVAMREKMRAGNASKHTNKADLFDLKHDKGGIIDVEFIVQYWVLAHAAKHAVLAENIGNIGLLQALAALGLINVESSQQVQLAYRQYREWLHAAKLQGQPASVSRIIAQPHINAVNALWQSTFSTG